MVDIELADGDNGDIEMSLEGWIRSTIEQATNEHSASPCHEEIE